MFLHCPGANDTFQAADVDLDFAARARIFYFGCPPLTARMYAGKEEELAALLKAVKDRGATTVPDMAPPDPQGASGRPDWPAILAGALPHTDVFAPSIEELAFMLRRRQYDRLIAAGDVLDQLTPRLLRAEDLSTAADYACVVGAQNLRAPDTTSGVRTWQDATAE